MRAHNMYVNISHAWFLMDLDQQVLFGESKPVPGAPGGAGSFVLRGATSERSPGNRNISPEQLFGPVNQSTVGFGDEGDDDDGGVVSLGGVFQSIADMLDD